MKFQVMAIMLVTVLLLACGSNQMEQPEESRLLSVVTTVSPITSIVENVGGERILLRGIIPEGANSHTFDPPPSTARVLAAADLFIANGLYLDCLLYTSPSPRD